jgi:membrane-associated HD superfamily phosphohydrolase
VVDQIREEIESTVTPLLREILDDARRLMHQEAQLVRVEVHEESAKMRQALTYVITGGVALFLAALLCSFMVVQLVATEWLRAPLWASFGIVGLASAILGAGLAYVGARRLRSVRESTERAMKTLREGFGWMQRTM